MVEPILWPEYGARLKKLIDALQLQQVGLVRMLGISEASLSHAIRGRNMLSNEKHIKLAEKTPINLHWLLTGSGSMFIPKAAKNVDWAKVEECLDLAKAVILKGRRRSGGKAPQEKKGNIWEDG